MECSCYGVSVFCLSYGTHIFEIENIIFAVLYGAPSEAEMAPFNFKWQHKRTGGPQLAFDTCCVISPVCSCVYFCHWDTACHPGSACLINGSAVIHCCYQTDDCEGLAQHVFI